MTRVGFMLVVGTVASTRRAVLATVLVVVGTDFGRQYVCCTLFKWSGDI